MSAVTRLVCMRLFVAALAVVAVLAASDWAYAQKPAPAIDAKDTVGVLWNAQSIKGKVVLLDIWASWCGPCKQEMPLLESLYRKHKAQGLVVIGVSVDESKRAMAQFVKDLGVTFPIIHDPEHEIAARYKPTKMPSSYVIGRDGTLAFAHNGFKASDKKKITAAVEKALAVKPVQAAEPTAPAQ